MHRVITIGREFGSGGREIGARLAGELSFAYYDKEIISAIADRSQLAEDYVNQVVENQIHSYYPITIAASFSASPEDSVYAVNRNIFAAQAEILSELAEKSDCVIVGRCADSDKELEKRIRSIDKARAQYYRFYTGESHDDRMTYDLGINTSQIAISDAVAAIAALVRAQK